MTVTAQASYPTLRAGGRAPPMSSSWPMSRELPLTLHYPSRIAPAIRRKRLPETGVLSLRKKARASILAFDLLFCDGQDLRYLPLTERKQKLRTIVPTGSECVLYCDHVERDGESLYRLAGENDLEGIVAKRKFDPYLPDQRVGSRFATRRTRSGKAVRNFLTGSGKAILIFHCGATALGLARSSERRTPWLVLSMG